MRFYIDSDNGVSISGWLIPDNPNEISRIKIYIPNGEPIEISASVMRQDLVDHGLHNTGMVAFRVDESLIPTLATESAIELREASSDLVFYRRFDKANHLERKLCLFDASVIPQNNISAAMRQHFSLSYNFIEKFAYETLWSIITAGYSSSILMTGRANYARHAATLRDFNFHIAALLHSPFEDLAERLLFLKLMSQSPNPKGFVPFATGLLQLADFTQTLDLNDQRSLDMAFRKSDQEKRQNFRDPMTRMHACNPDEKATRNHVTQALENLAGMSVVGKRDRFQDFSGMLEAELGVNVLGDKPLKSSPNVVELAAKLSGLGVVQDLLENDLALYSYFDEAVNLGLDTPAG
jgi:hypothetical protein